jgi:DNA-binding GntR family transcriptional regulator
LTSKPDSITDMVFDAIRDAIVTKALPPGSRISESSLATQLNVSKTPVRETLLRLRHVGLVEPAGRSLRVIMPAADRIRDAYELRAGLERAAVGYAATRANDTERDEIAHAAEASLTRAKAGDSAGFRRHDRDFHRAIASASHNQLLTEAINDALVLTSALRWRDVPDSGDSVVCGNEHIQIAKAVREGNPDAASIALADHIRHVMAMVLDSIPATS